METAEVRELKEKIEHLERLLESRADQVHELDMDDRRYERKVRSMKLAVTLALLCMTIFSIIPVAYNIFRSPPVFRSAPASSESILNEAFRNTTAKELGELNTFMAEFRKDTNKIDPERLSLGMVKSDVNLLSGRIGVLEKSISDSPEKALSIPLLRRDQESMSKTIEANKQAVNSELGRIYDQQKWMLTGIGTALLAALTALAGALYKTVNRVPD
ncbi:hypothetical protein [Pseudomonas cremoricolorata]|uniref:Uncharacterized protein n=1 Tax=Pseudomonas cremoricolorata TaxID=157783 RepID=A0A089WSR1_9PSED|nr:hypothetical protein [Pseudomonas cremoricolorata]AIR90194.1 hypothetical protein LK03_13215 [Pseudomonas cremoricolorata]